MGDAMRFLSHMSDDLRHQLACAQESIKFLRLGLGAAIAERDAARREVCSLEADTAEDQREYAVQRGWTDLFPKEQNDHTCAQVPAVRSKKIDK